MIYRLVLGLYGLVFINCALADVSASIFWYQEKETGTPASNMRYLVAKQFLRIDEGQAGDNFILFDAVKNTIYSVNHADQSILVITQHDWEKPNFDFDYVLSDTAMQDVPKISGKAVNRYLVRGDDDVCTEVQYVPGMFVEQMAVMQQYQKILSGQQVRSLANTPKDMHTPCFLADQVYNDGAYYARGLPIQIWHSRGYARILLDYKDEQVAEELFTIPEGFRYYDPIVRRDDRKKP